MQKRDVIENFSRLSRNQKISHISKLTKNPLDFITKANLHHHEVDEIQNIYEGFSENSLSNFFLPFGIAPNFLINGNIYHVPMVTEESSVIAAAASAAKFWLSRNGFTSKVIGTLKRGQVHFEWFGRPEKLLSFFNIKKEQLLHELEPLVSNMINRGGGITELKLVHEPTVFNEYYQLDVSFETSDSMGANFINSCLENLAYSWEKMVKSNMDFSIEERSCSIIMSILSNYNPDCRVICELRTPVNSFNDIYETMNGDQFVSKFIKAIQIANGNLNRAVTHNKGIFNGIDAVLIATGNDFRAVEACGHAYASKSGNYKSLTNAFTEEEDFIYRIEIPMSVGTVGGLTNIHPMASSALEILGNPSASELMQIAASVGLASNFSAIRALITSGIQKGHMKMHLTNIFSQLSASRDEKEKASQWFSDKQISFSAVRDYISGLRRK